MSHILSLWPGRVTQSTCRNRRTVMFVFIYTNTCNTLRPWHVSRSVQFKQPSKPFVTQRLACSAALVAQDTIWTLVRRVSMTRRRTSTAPARTVFWSRGWWRCWTFGLWCYSFYWRSRRPSEANLIIGTVRASRTGVFWRLSRGFLGRVLRLIATSTVADYCTRLTSKFVYQCFHSKLTANQTILLACRVPCNSCVASYCTILSIIRYSRASFISWPSMIQLSCTILCLIACIDWMT